MLGVIDAALGRKEEALREGRRAIELLPVEKDSINGLHMITNVAVIAAWVGEKDLAREQLATVVRCPASGFAVSYGDLKLSTFWDPLRCDPRFEKIVASAQFVVRIFLRNEPANPAEYLGERPEMTSHSGKPRKAKTMKGN